MSVAPELPDLPLWGGQERMDTFLLPGTRILHVPVVQGSEGSALCLHAAPT